MVMIWVFFFLLIYIFNVGIGISKKYIFKVNNSRRESKQKRRLIEIRDQVGWGFIGLKLAFNDNEYEHFINYKVGGCGMSPKHHHNHHHHLSTCAGDWQIIRIYYLHLNVGDNSLTWYHLLKLRVLSSRHKYYLY